MSPRPSLISIALFPELLPDALVIQERFILFLRSPIVSCLSIGQQGEWRAARAVIKAD